MNFPRRAESGPRVGLDPDNPDSGRNDWPCWPGASSQHYSPFADWLRSLPSSSTASEFGSCDVTDKGG